MSKVGERMQRATRGEGAPIGFGAAQARRKEPTMLLALGLPPAQATRAGEAAASGADTVIFGPLADKRQAKELGKWVKAAGEAPCGLWLGAATAEEVAAAKKAGIDYVVLSLEALASAVLDEEMGYLLALEEGMADTLLRTLDGLPLEAAMVSLEPGPLTLRRQLDVRRLVGLARLPLFLRLAEEPSPQEMESLREVGVLAIVVDGGRAEVWPLLAGLRRAIDGLPPRRRRREERLEAVLPLGQAAGMAEEEEEEEEEEFE